jgi:hypothetical protein
VTFIAQLHGRAFSDVVRFLGAVRFVTPEAFSLCHRIMERKALRSDAPMAGQAELFFIVHEPEFVIAARQRRVADRALPYLDL